MTRILALLVAMLVAVATPALADDAARAPEQLPEQLYVELVLNGATAGTILPIRREGDRIWADAADLRAARIAITGHGPVELATLPGVTADYDGPRQRLRLNVPPALLPVTALRTTPRQRARTVAETGALLSYDAYLQTGDRGTAASLWTEQRLFGAFGTLSNAGTFSVGPDGPARYLRYDTRLRHIDEDRALVAIAGDLFTAALPWSGSVRVGGLQLARSYRVRPDLLTMPLPRFAGQAALPSAVDLYIDGTRQSSSNVDPGRFVLDDLPVVNGAGEITVVTTDAVGRQVATTVPFYVAPDLLRRGLTDFSVEAGLLRRGFGIRNLSYGAAVASATVRRGLSDRLTLEAHGEGSARLGLFGAGIVWSPGLWGAVNASAAVSRSGRRTGTQLAVGYSYSSRRFSIGAEHIERSRDHADLAAFDLGRLGNRMRSDRMSMSLSLGRFGAVGAGYLSADRGRGGRARLLTASWSMHLGDRVAALASLNHDMDRGATSAQLRLLVPLGGTRQMGASAGLALDPSRHLSAQVGVSRSIPTDGGLGFAVDAAIGRGRIEGQASAAWRGSAMRGEAGLATAAGRTIGWIGAGGALIAIDGGLYSANTAPDAFAIVATGAPGVPVRFENQRVGVTDRRGRLFVPAVGAYQNALYAIDPIGLADGMRADVVERRVALREGTGAIVRMPVHHSTSVMATLVDADGRPLDAGGRASFGTGRTTLVGWGGLLLLDDVQGDLRITVDTAAGRRCTATLTIPENPPAFARLAPSQCL